MHQIFPIQMSVTDLGQFSVGPVLLIERMAEGFHRTCKEVMIIHNVAVGILLVGCGTLILTYSLCLSRPGE